MKTEDYEDTKIHAQLSKERPERNVMLNEQEEADLEKRFGV